MSAVLAATFSVQRGELLLEVTLTLAPGVSALLGPSGSGKSTTLEVLAGHLQPDQGRITLGEQDLIAAPPRLRHIGYLPQQPALFPHMSVADNLGYGIHRLARADRAQRVQEIAERLGVAGLLARRPGSLSGGERQRVALARALLPRPRALLLDEPLSAVDVPARQALLHELQALLAALAIPVLYVTHDEGEAAALCQTVLRCQPEALSDVGGGSGLRCRVRVRSY